MAWIAITESDVRTSLLSSELAAIQSPHAASGDTQLVSKKIQEVVDEVRGYIAAWPDNQLEEGAKIPSKLLGAALALIRYRIISSIPSQTLLTESRRTEKEDAMKLLERVSDGKFRIEDPVITEDETVRRAGPKITAKTRTYRRADADGI